MCLPRTSLRTSSDEFMAAWCGRCVERRSDDCEALFEHYRGAGDFENASIQAGLAGEKAGGALAFDRSASFYRHALALSPISSRAQRMERRARHRAGQRRPARRRRRGLSACGGGRRRPSASRAAAARRRTVPDRRAHRSRSGADSHDAREHGHGCAAKFPRPPCCRCCGGAHGFDGGVCTSCRGMSTTSMQIRSCVWTRAGRRRRDCCSST